MNPISRLVMLAGLALVVAGLAFALGVSYFVDHEARLVAYDAYQPTFETVMQDTIDSEWQAELAQANRISVTHRRAADVHTHSVNMGMLLILIGLLAPLLSRVKKQSTRVLWVMISSAWIYPLGLLLQFAGLTQVGEAVAALGAALAIAALVWLFRILSRALDTIIPS